MSFHLIVLALLLLSDCEPRQHHESTPAVCRTNYHGAVTTDATDDPEMLRKQYDEIGSVACCERYIEKVINEGSNVLNLPAGSMAPDYADPTDAPKIAAYIITLSDRIPTHPEYIQEGNLYYNGNCSGCHGNDGKGLDGAYPDITSTLFAGMALKKEALKYKIDALQKTAQSR